MIQSPIQSTIILPNYRVSTPFLLLHGSVPIRLWAASRHGGTVRPEQAPALRPKLKHSLLHNPLRRTSFEVNNGQSFVAALTRLARSG